MASISAATEVLGPPLQSLEHKRDTYGFAIRPQHVQRYHEYAIMYKEEEEERSHRWKNFLEQRAKFADLQVHALYTEEDKTTIRMEIAEQEANWTSEKGAEGDDLSGKMSGSVRSIEDVKECQPAAMEMKAHRVQTWADISPSLHVIEDMMSLWVKKKSNLVQHERGTKTGKPPLVEEVKSTQEAREEESDEEFYDVNISDSIQDVPSSGIMSDPAKSSAVDLDCPQSLYLLKEELESLVRGGLPMALRGELWQAFVGVRARRVEKYYQDLLGVENNASKSLEKQVSQLDISNKGSNSDFAYVPEKWLGQIEKDLPRTFPGHPALDEDGRNALRRVLIAYARHKPSVGYCQAMNFFAGLLLLLMPEENAFWTLMAMLDDYFDGYYSEEMIESQVDQLVFEELVRDRFPKLVKHLDYLGVQVEWITGPWFLSIFMNMLPWESVVRVWDVLLFEGNRVMLFRTALALMELYAPALMTTTDAGDAVALLQSLAGSTFDSSQLVMTACMSFQNVNETRLHELRNKRRPAIRAMLEERSRGLRPWRDPQESGSVDGILMNLTGNVEIDSVPDLHEQAVLLKVQYCKLLDEKQTAVLRTEELETALMEMIKQDNRQQLSTRVEQLDQEVAVLRKALAAKQAQENALLQVLIKVEQEQRVTEEARRYAEQEAAAQRQAAKVLQEKCEEVTATLAEVAKKVVMTESTLEATLQYQSGQIKTQPALLSVQQNSSPVLRNQETRNMPMRKMGFLPRSFGLGRPDKNKEKLRNVVKAADGKSSTEEQKVTNGHQAQKI